jgi:hypothetical protein
MRLDVDHGIGVGEHRASITGAAGGRVGIQQPIGGRRGGRRRHGGEDVPLRN